MAKETRPSLTYKWASGGTTTSPTNAKIEQGWTHEKPPYAYFNFIDNRQDQLLAYMLQQGIPEWVSTIEYQNGSSFVTYSGKVYKSIQTGTNKNPSTETAYWKEWTGLDLSASISLIEPLQYLVIKPTTVDQFGSLTVAPNKATATTSLFSVVDRADYVNYSSFIMGIGVGGASLQTLGNGTESAYNLTISAGGSNVNYFAKTDGTNGIGTTSPSCALDINSNKVRIRTSKTPSSATDTGNAGDICWDSDYVYVCVATNTWKRSALSTW